MKRWFSLALVLALCFTTVWGDFATAVADDEYDIVFDDNENGTETVYESEDEDEDAWLPEEDESEGEDGSGADVTGETAETGTIDGTVDIVPDVDLPEDASGTDDEPQLWYARANQSLSLQIDDVLSRNIPEGSILLVIGKTSDPMLRVACETLSGTVDASMLDALTPDELDAFMVGVTQLETVKLYDDNMDYPLPPDPVSAQEEIPAVEESDDGTEQEEDTQESQPLDDTTATSDETNGEEKEDGTTPSESPKDVENKGLTEGVADADSDGANEDDTADGEKSDEAADGEKTEDEAADGEKSDEMTDSEKSGEDADGEKSDEDADGEGKDDADEASEDAEQKEDAEDAEESQQDEAAADAEKAEGEEATEDADKEGEAAEAQADPAAEVVAAEADTANKSYEAGPPASISLNLGSITLGLKEAYTGLTGTVVDAAGTPVEGQTIAWVSSNVRVVKVDAAGKLTAVRKGKATIVARVEGLPDATVSVFVKSAPTKVTLKPKKANLSIGMGYQLAPKLSKGTASGRLTYTSSNPGVAQVDENGMVTGTGVGSATITVSTYNKKKARFKAYVFSAPASISTDKPAYALLQTMKDKMVINILDASGIKTYANLNVVSSDPNCVAVDALGNIVGVNIGSATITITTHNGLSTSCTVDVCGQAADMVLNADTITIGVKEKYNRMAYTLVPPAGQDKCAAIVTWKSKNKKIAKVNKKTGVITGVKAGTTTIIATTNNKISRKVKVVVKKAPKSVAVSPKELALTIGMTGQLTASYNAKNVNTNMTYTSSDPNIAQVDENGVVRAVGRGSAVITVRTYNGKTDTCTVNVYNDPAQVMVTETLTVAVGSKAQLACSVVDAEGQPSTASYSYTAIAESGAVEVDSDGYVKGVTVGTARVKVSTQNGITTHLDASGLPVETECYVTVVEAPPVRYRMFAAYDFYNVSAKGSLTFPMNNATSFLEVFATSNIDGKQYERVGLMENPSKDALLSGIPSAFSDSVDTDINLIYLVSHGTNYVDVAKTAKSTHYGLQLPGYTNYKCSSEYYITSEEIFNAISGIRGQVILVLDSCYSGQFITNMKSALDAAGGRISVMTAATNTTACYYNISNTSTACDFFTMYLLIGAGYNMRSHTYSGAHPADSNADGKLTFNELFNYAKKSVKANVPKYKSKSWFHGNYKQTPNVYKGNNGDLVLFQYN